MERRGIIYKIRALIAERLDIRSDEAAKGDWWEIDLIIVILAGAFAIGLLAFLQL